MRVRRCAPRTSQNIPTSQARRIDGWYSAFCSDRCVVAEAMLSAGGPHRPVTFHAPEEISRWWDLTLAHCRATSAGAPDGVAPTDSQCVAMMLLNFLDEWVRPEVIKSSRRYRTFTRDGWRCQAPGCGSRAHLNAHHVIFRSRNGPDAGWNLVTICRACHEMIHSGCISVRGRAPDGLEWAMGINSSGDVRERYRNGLRVACDPTWTTLRTAAPRTVAPDDWRQSCDAVA